MTLTILITGASSGIGRHAAIEHARAGQRARVAARRLAALEELQREAPVEPLPLDLDDPASIAALVAELERRTEGRGLDVLVNNAGFATAGALAELGDAALRAQFETNVFGLMTLTRAVLPAMLARGAGRVINVSSVSGRIPAPILGAYLASKYAREARWDALRLVLGPFGVRVAVIVPGTSRREFASRAC